MFVTSASRFSTHTKRSCIGSGEPGQSSSKLHERKRQNMQTPQIFTAGRTTTNSQLFDTGNIKLSTINLHNLTYLLYPTVTPNCGYSRQAIWGGFFQPIREDDCQWVGRKHSLLL